MDPNHPISFHSTCLFVALIAAVATVAPCKSTFTTGAITKPGCPGNCGNVTIPYPFGIGNDSGCSLSPIYNVIFGRSSNPPKAFLEGDDGMLEILDISETHIHIRTQVAVKCYNSFGELANISGFDGDYVMSVAGDSPFGFSSTSNKLVAIGCEISAAVSGNTGDLNSCKSVCSNKEDVEEEGKCNGLGCCQSPIPHGLKSIQMSLGPLLFGSTFNVVSFSPCGYAFLAEEGQYTFRGIPDFNDPNFVERVTKNASVAIDWVVGNGTCAEAQRNQSSYACKGNTTCSDDSQSEIGGYKCYCSSGFQGNPYLYPGCSDIDECAYPNLSNCSMVCQNEIESFRCSCPNGYAGDGKKNGSGCRKKTSMDFVLKLCLGISCGFLFLVIGFSWLYIMDKKRKVIKMKKKYFEQNGGWLLKEQLSATTSVGNTEPTKIFTEEELKIATNNFSKRGILGNGGYGIVYKGVLPNNRVVAIKKSKVVDEDQIEQFINEVVILGQINHRNVVKLLGCCLETEVPLLVYEFISKGTLYNHIHESSISEEKGYWRLTWSECLRIASETANVLAYLHSAASPPIIHRDIKSMNILLDEDYTTKIADFGGSRLIPMDQSKLSTLVQGTLGYLDPEYLYSSLLTEKSDVYSFGVVLAELLTRQKSLSPIRSEEDRNLATYFLRSIEQGTLFDILDPQWVTEASTSELVSMGSITQRCLNISGQDRPTMREVFMELEAIMKPKRLSTEDQQMDDEAETTMTIDEEDHLSIHHFMV